MPLWRQARARSTASSWRKRWHRRRAAVGRRWGRRCDAVAGSDCAIIHQAMPALVLVAPTPLSGKTTIAAGLAQRLKAEGKTVALSRLGDDANAAADKALFAAISSPTDAAQVTITEAASGDTSGDGRAVVIADATLPAPEIARFCSPLGGRLAGLVLNRVPQRRTAAIRSDAEAQGMRVLGVLAEDRLLASPTLGEVADALEAEKMFFDSKGGRAPDPPPIPPFTPNPP